MYVAPTWCVADVGPLAIAIAASSAMSLAVAVDENTPTLTAAWLGAPGPSERCEPNCTSMRSSRCNLCNSARSCEAPRGLAPQDAGRCGNRDPESRSANNSCSERTTPLRRARTVPGSRARANLRGRGWRRSIPGDTSDSGWRIGRAGLLLNPNANCMLARACSGVE